MSVKLTDAEIKALEDASWTGGRKAWLAAIEDIIAARLADAWDEAVRAMAWCLDNGPADSALPYVAEHNPYREPTP